MFNYKLGDFGIKVGTAILSDLSGVQLQILSNFKNFSPNQSSHKISFTAAESIQGIDRQRIKMPDHLHMEQAHFAEEDLRKLIRATTR